MTKRRRGSDEGFSLVRLESLAAGVGVRATWLRDFDQRAPAMAAKERLGSRTPDRGVSFWVVPAELWHGGEFLHDRERAQS